MRYVKQEEIKQAGAELGQAQHSWGCVMLIKARGLVLAWVVVRFPWAKFTTRQELVAFMS